MQGWAAAEARLDVITIGRSSVDLYGQQVGVAAVVGRPLSAYPRLGRAEMTMRVARCALVPLLLILLFAVIIVAYSSVFAVQQTEHAAFQFCSVLLPTVGGVGETVDNERCWRIEWNSIFFRFCQATGGNLLFNLELYRKAQHLLSVLYRTRSSCQNPNTRITANNRAEFPCECSGLHC